ncbi:MAG: C-type polyheme cytochrome OmcC [Chloroflexi bacterium]|nr:C-type polyheme cytochrome OmcC [Chloroflexota bacterium]
MKRTFIILAILVSAILLLGACNTAPAETEAVEVVETECPECPEVPECPEAEPCPEPLVEVVPFAEAWAGSGHADSEAEAFRHWDEDDPAVVSTRCGKCHSSAGYVEHLETGAVTVETPAEENMGVMCVACHNEFTATKDSVIMPSGIELTGLGDESRCMECHQGRHSTVSVNESIAEAAGVEITVAEDAEDPVQAQIAAAAEAAGQSDPDMVYEELGFANIHYFAAAASKYGTLAKGGYEYEGKSYDGNFAHVEEFDTCIECHSPHTLEVRADECVMCHGEGDPQDYRMKGSAVDYDGDGDMEEGIAAEITGLQEALSAELQAYAADVIGTGVLYDAHSYPYFFNDSNGDGEAAEDEINYGNKYATWTPRLLRAAYNYQVSMKDPGGFAHGGKYIIQLLADSIEDLNAEAVAELKRIDHGHFAGSEEAFRHWDDDGEVSGRCSRCHSADGLPAYLTEGIEVAQPISNGFQCETCHGGGDWPARYPVSSVTFPSGASVDVSETPDAGICMSCHQGRSSTVDVNQAVAGLAADEVSEDLGFINVHYFAAGASRYGTEAQGGYEFEGKEYVGYFEHVDGYQACTDCHDAHELEVKTDDCFTCHAGVESLEDIRKSETDFDGDGDVEEGLYGEILTLSEALYPAMQVYANDVVGTGILYDSHSYPYFFTDTNGNGESDPGEAIYPNKYATWTPELLEAAYNYQYAQKDPGGFAHNGMYIIQLLIDGIEAVGGDVTSYTRP